MVSVEVTVIPWDVVINIGLLVGDIVVVGVGDGFVALKVDVPGVLIVDAEGELGLTDGIGVDEDVVEARDTDKKVIQYQAEFW